MQREEVDEESQRCPPKFPTRAKVKVKGWMWDLCWLPSDPLTFLPGQEKIHQPSLLGLRSRGRSTQEGGDQETIWVPPHVRAGL